MGDMYSFMYSSESPSKPLSFQVGPVRLFIPYKRKRKRGHDGNKSKGTVSSDGGDSDSAGNLWVTPTINWGFLGLPMSGLPGKSGISRVLVILASFLRRITR